MKGFKILRNRYFVVFVLFAAWMLFFDASSMLKLVSQKSINKELRKEIDKYDRETSEIAGQTKALRHSNDSLEKFARETFYLKKEREEIFLIREK